MKKSVKVFIFLFIIICAFGTSPQAKIINDAQNYVPAKSMDQDTHETGEQLAKLYCAMCHLFPAPELLDKKTWNSNVLPNMGLRLGIKNPNADSNPNLTIRKRKDLKKQGLVPDQPLVSNLQWTKIVDYYATNAPSEPIHIEHSITYNDLYQFNVTPIFIDDKPLPKTTMLKFNPTTSELFVGDGHNFLYTLDDKMNLKISKTLLSPPIDMDFPGNGPHRMLTIGVFEPSDKRQGQLSTINEINSLKRSKRILNKLPRPVQFATGDFNSDDKEDVVICGFGNTTGELKWYENFDPEKEHILKPLPGATKVEVADFNNDGKADIMALMAQAYEQISIFYNQGNNEFKEEVALQFSPVHGVSYFETMDFNKDGYLDILLVNGDNWDLSPIRKSYHGIRIYLNDGKNNFEESFFYPMDGATKAVVRDFDGDNDLDIAAISFYANHDKPEHGFVYLSNEGNFNFKTFVTPNAAEGKWLTMEVGDFDDDGDMDIVLGSYFHKLSELAKLAFKGIFSYPQLIVLENNQN